MNPTNIQQLLTSTFSFLKEDDVNKLLEIGSYQKLGNKEIIIKCGDNNPISFFILKGMVRGYFTNAKGEEKNIFLRPEHTVTGAPECLFHNQPTKYTFESILETKLFIFNNNDLQALGAQYPNFHQIYIKSLQENVLTLISRVESLIDLSPAERYEALLQQSPQFFQTAFNKHIANYLGITPVSLSRIIKRRMKE